MQSCKKHEKTHNKKEFYIYDDCVVSNVPQKEALLKLNRSIERLTYYRGIIIQKKYVFDKDIHQPNYKYRFSEEKEKPIELKMGLDNEEKDWKHNTKNNYFNINSIYDFNN